MARREYLSPEERLRFDAPPILTVQQRPILFDLPQWAEIYLENLQRPTNRVGFLLQLGYFRVTTRFFEMDRFADEMIEWVCQQVQIPINEVLLPAYVSSRAVYHHRQVILRQLGYTAFDDEHTDQLTDEARRLAHLQTRPALLLDALAGYLREHRIEVPSYNSLRTILTEALERYEDRLEELIDTQLTELDRHRLDELLQKPPTSTAKGRSRKGNQPDQSRIQYRLTSLKRITQSMQPGHIQERVKLFVELKVLFTQLAPLIQQLDLSDDTIRYYAQYVLDTKSRQTAQRQGERYLRLIAFVTYQYLTLGDALVLTFQQAVTALINEGEQTLKETLYDSRQALAHLVGQVVRRSDAHVDVLTQLEQIISDEHLPDSEKVALIRQLLQQKRVTGTQLTTDKDCLQQLKETNQPLVDREDYYQMLEAISVRLQGRVAMLVQELVFDQEPVPRRGWRADILAALHHYQQTGGTLLPGSPPLDFLDMDERQRVITAAGKLRLPLYKVFLFCHLQRGLRSGQLNVLSSFEYRAVDEYLLPRSQWQVNRQAYLAKANLQSYERPAPALTALGERLNRQFARTNERLAGNTQVFLDKEGQWHLHRYEADDESAVAAATRLYPINRVIALRDVLRQVQGLTDFLSAFTHQGFMPDKPTRPDERLLLAAIIGYGENIGVRKMGLISRGISINALETVATHYFSPEGVLRANDIIVAQSYQLPLANQFRRQSGFVHTGSDGQKYDVSGPILRAAASFKYFGNGQGITIYTHLDEAGQLLYSTAFSAADRESAYMLDAITYNEVITPDAHSTDTHGSTEPVFGVTGLLGIDFRPRFARIHHQQLYSLDAVALFKKQGYKLLPDHRVDYENLLEQWDDVLRFVATIKLGYAKESQLFKRLNSYDQHHPLYKALRDLGRLYKTDFILRLWCSPNLGQVLGQFKLVSSGSRIVLFPLSTPFVYHSPGV